MKILLDECVTKKLKPFISYHEVNTVTEMGWNGLKNGKLMTKCVENSFDILLTIDKNIALEQNYSKYPISVVVFDCETSKIAELKLFVPNFERQLPNFMKGHLYNISKNI